MREEKTSVFDAHKAVEPMCLSGGIMAEFGGRELGPLTIGIGEPLRAVERLSLLMPVLTAEVFTEGMQATQVLAVLGRAATRDDHPVLLFGVQTVSAGGLVG